MGCTNHSLSQHREAFASEKFLFLKRLAEGYWTIKLKQKLFAFLIKFLQQEMAEFKRSYQQDIRRMQAERDEYSQVSSFPLEEYHIKVTGSLNIL